MELCHSQLLETGPYTCPCCRMGFLTENALHLHLPLYHSMEGEMTHPERCPICACERKLYERKNFYLHLHNSHGPEHEREPHFPAFSAFTWIVCQRSSDGRFLIVNEPAGLCDGVPKYWLPAGRVDEGESFVEAGIRETLEEGGVKCRI